MKNSRANRHNDRGFTLPEVLLTVAILVVLFALAAIPITKMQRELRQTELDAKAEILFQTAQNRITQLMAAGMGEKCQLGTKQMTDLPADADEDNYTGENIPLFYVTDTGKEDPRSAACYILPQDGTEPELWSNHWVVEFDRDSGSVYAVFYSEEDLSAYPEGFQLLRSRDYRVKKATIGYYGGDSVTINDTGILKPTVRISNGEKLEIEVSCTAPDDKALTFRVTLRDSEGHTAGPIVFSDKEVERGGYMGCDYTATMVLDDLSGEGDMRFARQERLKDLLPGSNLTVTVDVTSKNMLIEPAVWQGETNGLFDTVRGGNTAVITCARHLQNLDESSGVIEAITAAVQEQNIDFTGAGSWSDVYPGMKFKPIRNGNLKSYSSYVRAADIEVYPVIAHLPVETTGSAGLFEAFAGTISGVRLSGARIYGGSKADALIGEVTGKVGALIGEVTGKVKLDNCRVYLDPRSDALSVKDENDVWIEGGTVGGLIGYIGSGGSATVTASFAATVLHGSAEAGGLIGRVDGAASLDRCYADCYLYSNETSGRTGGLIGGTGENTGVGTRPVTLKNCYAAGFQKASVTAGLSAGRVYSMIGCYSAVAGLGTDRLTYSTAAAYAGTEGAAVERTFYLAASKGETIDIDGTTHVEWNGTNRTAAAQQLNGGSENEFTSVTGGGSTVAYNLMKGMGLSDYSYPKLKGIPHYGDWKAEFESGSLAYYEKYHDGSYGFLGGNVQVPLSNTDIVGDGYGVVYNAKPTAEDKVMVKYKNAEADSIEVTLDPKDAIEISSGGKTYYLLPLPNEAVNTAYVPAESFYQEIEISGTTYLYAPHFARTVTTPGENGTAEKPESVLIRTARQLYNLSLYYEAYASTIAENAGFTQESIIDYDTYNWKSYTLAGNAMPARQMPIGSRESAPFRHTYDGCTYAVKDAPISGSNLDGGELSVYAGLFGYNCGRLQNIVLLSGETNNTVIGFDKGIQHKTAYVGTVVGYNDGQVYNCAGAGYRVKALANSGSTVYVGGFAGYNGNDGRFDRCSVSIPSIYAESVFAQLSVGGFIGGNEGRIDRSYGIAAVNVPTIRGGGAKLGGFAAANGGIIRGAYCAAAMFSAGAETDGFASSGSVRDCHYLNGGTYRFAGEDRLYNTDTVGGAQPETAMQLKKLSLTGFGKATESLYHKNTEEESNYPYPSCVQNRDGKTVHYGDWPVPTNAGELGMFYWEKEEGGANDGYHFSYIGFVGTERKEGSTLCTVHDDGGVVTAYGYGYYWENTTQKQPTLKFSSSFNATGDKLTGGETEEAAAAAKALSAQMPGYDFAAYETGKTGLRLQSADDANGEWMLTSSVTEKVYRYTLCPFFANAFSDQDSKSADKPGSAGKPYQIRSVEQLQFINWSWSKNQGCTTDRVVTGDTYKSFPYLQYATVTGRSKQSREAAEAVRPALSWKQTHDLNGADREHPSDGTKNTTFYPIAGAIFYNQTEKPENAGYAVSLYNWFGGIYDGDNYYIKNINVKSPCYNVGIFGTTAGAQLRNIVLYSDNGGTVERSTETAPYNGYRCAYALGGLVGIAYDYLYYSNGTAVGADERATITNCAIAGYTILDNSTNPLQLGEAVVGGLIGVSKVNLNSCSAVVDIAVNCTHRKSDDRKSADWNKLTAAQYGNYVRVGGMVGGAQYMVTNCYTGGSIKIGDDTLNERVDESGNLVTAKSNKEDSKKVKKENGTYVYIGGIGGSGFSSNFRNFTWKDGTDDGQPLYKNCYTYVEFPTMEGTIMAISRIGSVADRYEWAPSLTISNCYYYEQNPIQYKLPKCRVGSGQSLEDILSDTQSDNPKEEMLKGNLNYLSKYIGNRSQRPTYQIDLTKLSYEQLSGGSGIKEETPNSNILDLLNGSNGGAFRRVTTEEVGASIHGKYSFPGKKKDVLDGQDYPFPTVLTQKSNHTDGYVSLHYGDWPVAGPAWESSRVTIDRIADYKPESGKASCEVKLRLQNMTGASLEKVDLAVTGSGASIVEIAESKVVEEAAADGKKDTYLLVTLTGLKNGSAEITATLDRSYVARLTVSVTAQLGISLQSDLEANNMITVDKGSEQKLELQATARDGVLSAADRLTWRVVSADPTIAEVYAQKGAQNVRGKEAGETTLLIRLSYELNEDTTIETSRIVPVTVYEKADGE